MTTLPTHFTHSFIHTGMFATEYVADGLFHNTAHTPYVSLCDLICYSESYQCKKKKIIPMSYSWTSKLIYSLL